MKERRGSLTKEQLHHYNEEGYLVIPGFLADEDLAPARAAMGQKTSMIADELFAEGLIPDKLEHRPFEYRLAEIFQDLSDQEFLRFGRGWRDRLPGYYHLMANTKILDAVESLIGGEIFANPVYNVRPKVPRVAAGAVPWHQDKSYWPGANANPVITVWIAFVDANLENGCLHIKPRTHKRHLVAHHAETYSGTAYTEVDKTALRRTETVALPVRKGTAILFNDRCLHMSTPNNAQTVRWSVDLRYQPTDQDPMLQHGAGFLARSYLYPERVATLEDWLAGRLERGTEDCSPSFSKTT